MNLIKDDQHSEYFRSLNPKQEVPFYVDGHRGIAQSMAILLYLDDRYPAFPLFPKDPYQKAFCIQQCEIINSSIQPFHNLKVLNELKSRFDINEEAKNAWIKFWILEGLRPLEVALSNHSKDYSLGNEPSALDAFLVPQVFTCMRYNISLEDFPLINHVFNNCQKHLAFQKAQPSSQPDYNL